MDSILEVKTKARFGEFDSSNTQDLITEQLNTRQEQAFKRLQELNLSKETMKTVDECIILANASGARFGRTGISAGPLRRHGKHKKTMCKKRPFGENPSGLFFYSLGGCNSGQLVGTKEAQPMQITELNSMNAMEHCQKLSKPTVAELQQEYDYYKAQQIVKSMYNCGLISEYECTRLEAKNREYFSPLLARIS